MTTPPTWPSCWPGWAGGQGGSRISEPQVSGHSGHAPGFLSTDSIPHLPFFGPPLKTTTLFQGHRNHCPEQPPECSAPLPSLNHHPGPWSCPWFLPLARERVSRHNRWRPVCRGGCPIQEKNQVLFSCFLRFAHVAPPAALPFLLCLPQPPSSPPAADVCVGGGRGKVGGWGCWSAQLGGLPGICRKRLWDPVTSPSLGRSLMVVHRPSSALQAPVDLLSLISGHF